MPAWLVAELVGLNTLLAHQRGRWLLLRRWLGSHSASLRSLFYFPTLFPARCPFYTASMGLFK